MVFQGFGGISAILSPLRQLWQIVENREGSICVLKEIDDYENQLSARVTETKTKINEFCERVNEVARALRELSECQRKVM